MLNPEAAPTVRLAVVAFPDTRFDPSIQGVEIITMQGTDVPAHLEKEVRAAARKAGIKLKKLRS